MSYLKKAGGNISSGFKKGVENIGNAMPTDASIAEKVGLGRFKAKMPDTNESAFTDFERSNTLISELEKQRTGAGERTFKGAQTPTLGFAQTMNAADIGKASQMSSARLANEERARAAVIDPRDQMQMRAGQQDLISALQAQSQGQGPSLAAMQMDDARSQQIQTAMALAASQRGLGAGQGLRQIADQTQNANQVAVREAMRGRIAEQLAAREQLQNSLAGTRAQDIGIATSQAGLNQQTALTNQAAANQFALTQGSFDQQAAAANQSAINQFAVTQGQMDQQAAAANQAAMNNFALTRGQMGLQTELANMQGGLTFQGQQDNFLNDLNQQISGLTMGQQASLQDLERMRMQAALGIQGINAESFAGQQEAFGKFLSGLSSSGTSLASAAGAGGAGAGGAGAGGAAAAAPAAAAASDINLKTKIKTNDSQIEDFLSKIGSHSYEYKDKKWGEGRYISPMAQELEKSEIGKSMVVDTDEGKVVDYARGSGAYLSIASMLNKKLKKIEQQLNKRGA